MVFAGGGVGSVLRYLIGQKTVHFFGYSFPYGTLIINILACFVLGCLTGLAEQQRLIQQNMKLLLMTGFCGGFSTFSTFSAESVSLFQNGNYTGFGIYLLLSNLAGILALLAGMLLVPKI